MADKRRNTSLRNTRTEIIKILSANPKQAKDLRSELGEKGIGYSRVGLNDLLNLLIDSGDIQRKIIEGNSYPVYAVTDKSKILAELQGYYFQAHFKINYYGNHISLLKEFQKENHTIDPVLKFFGFYVLGSLVTSHALEKKDLSDKDLKQKDFEVLRQEWLKPVLDLQRGLAMSDFFDEYFDTKKSDLPRIIEELQKYKKNMWILESCFENSMKNNPKIKKLSDETFDKSVIDNMEKLRK
jgi:hypothetical protein